ncbi:MAG: hypothetical protein GC190_07255 [Alphaproteobacteria bacterium]|nr:hypothetical protein [Alphaproteobacteria bacterium]
MRSATASIRLVILIGIALCLMGADATSASDTVPNPGRDIAITLQAAEIAEGLASRDRWDAAFVVKRVGKDPAKLFAWVQTNSFWIPYRGVLRGPVGVLMDGRGNSLDRSLLLADLLKRAGQTVRLAHGQMTQQDAVTRLSQLVAREANANGPVGNARLSVTGAAMLNAATAQLSTEKQDAARRLATLNARTAAQTRRLLQMIEKPDASDEWSDRFVTALEALQDHWWVQRQTAAGWVDMDVLTPDGKAAVSLQSTSRPEDLGIDGLYQEITLRVVAEQWTPGSLAEHVAMEHKLRPADLIGKAIVLQFWPTAPIKSRTPAGREELKTAKGGEWAAILTIDRDAADAGILPESGDDLDQPPQGGAFGGIAGSFGSTFAPPAQRSTPKSTLSAVWLEYEFKSPGQESRKVRREIFDLVGPSRRAEGAPQQLALDDTARAVRERAMAMRSEILPLPCAIAPSYVTHLVSQALLRSRQILTAATQPNVTDAAVFEMTQHAAPPVTSLYALALAATSIGSTSTYVDKPLLFTNHFYPKPGDASIIVNATDIVANDIGVSLAVNDAFSARLAEGVRHTNAESLFHGPIPGYSTADAFAQPGAWAALTASDEAAINALTLPADVRRRILDEVMNGQIVVAPRVALSTPSGPYAGWWRIDPATGTTLGFGANGWGASATERGFLARVAGAAGRAFMKNYARIIFVFTTGYAFCVAPKIVRDYGLGREADTEEPPRLGLKLTIKNSASQCLAEGGFFAALATLPLVASEVNAAAEAPRVPSEPAPPELAPPAEPPCPGGGRGPGTEVMPAPGRPGSGNTQPMPARPNASPPVGSRPPGPFQMDPANKAWQREGYEAGHTAAVAMGDPAIFEFADQAARSTYNGAIQSGATVDAAFQASKDMWFEAVKQGQGNTIVVEGYPVGSGRGGKTVGMPSAPGPVPGKSPMAQTGEVPVRSDTLPMDQAPPRVPPTQPMTQPVQTPAQSPKASTGVVPRQSPNASSGPVAQRPPLQQRPPGEEVKPITPEGEAPQAGAKPVVEPKLPSVAEAEANLKQVLRDEKAARIKSDQLSTESREATSEFVRYRARKPRPGKGWEGDPDNWDQATDQKLQENMTRLRSESDKALLEANRLDQELLAARRDYYSAKGRADRQAQCGGQ